MKSLKLSSAVGVAFSLLFEVSSTRGEIVERVVAKVNGDIVTLTEFETRQIGAVQQAHIARDAIPAFLQENNARILQEAIDDILLFQRAQELGMRLRADYINEVVEGIKKDNNITSEEDFREQLRREGLTLDGLRRNIERSILRRQVVARELDPKTAVPDEEVRAEYDAHLAEYTRPESVRVQQILLSGDDAAPRADAIVARARAGEDFADLARAHSQDPTRNVDLGTFARGELTADLEKAVFALQAGEISDPIATSDGIRILRIVEKQPGGVVPYAEVKNKVRDRLAQDRWGKEYERYIEGLRKAAMIDIKVREVPLQITPPTGGTVLDVGGGREGSVSSIGSSEPARSTPEPEIVTTPQDKPQHVVPPPRPGDPKIEEKKPDGSSKDENPTSPPSPDGVH